MILGDICTRRCTFCGVSKTQPLPVDRSEPVRVALAAKELALSHCVITSVTRDDLEDGGAHAFAETVLSVRSNGGPTVEVLTPDFGGSRGSIDVVLSAAPDVYGHNVETVPRLYRSMRPDADYERSVSILRYAKGRGDVVTKSGLILGLGEKAEEVEEVMWDLSKAGCDILTMGQYLPPTASHPSPSEYVHPEKFEDYRLNAVEFGFKAVLAGPFVRSSYQAASLLKSCLP
jgi:lipoic acid synthetase